MTEFSTPPNERRMITADRLQRASSTNHSPGKSACLRKDPPTPLLGRWFPSDSPLTFIRPTVGPAQFTMIWGKWSRSKKSPRSPSEIFGVPEVLNDRSWIDHPLKKKSKNYYTSIEAYWAPFFQFPGPTRRKQRPPKRLDEIAILGIGD